MTMRGAECPLCWYGESAVKVALHLGDEHHWSDDAVEGWLRGASEDDDDGE
jgi:hypothetical protein